MSPDAQTALDPGSEASFTGERFLPQCSGEIAYEHWHRYAFARSLAARKTVLDVASGEGYGAALLASVATRVCGADIDAETVARAARKYAALGNLAFMRASCTCLPFADRSFDLIVSFETIEHIGAPDQLRMLEEFDRLLAPDGMLVLSSPNRAEYSDVRGTRNEFHVHELYRDELAKLLARHFSATRWFGQRIQCWSGIWSDSPAAAPIEALCVEPPAIVSYGAPQAVYYVVIAGRSEAAIAAPLPRGSILTDHDDSVTKRYETAVGALIEQYKLVDELSAGADRQTAHILHLEDLVRQHAEAIEHQASQVKRLASERDRAIEAAREQAATLQKDLDQLRSVNLDQQSSIDALRERVARLTETVRRLHSWRSWLRFPVHRLRGDPPPI